MAKSKKVTPTTVSAADVKTQKRTLTKLQNQLTRNARKNTTSINQLIATQADEQAANVEQISLLQKAATASAAATVEDPKQLALEAALRQNTTTVANAQADTVASAAVNDLRDKQKSDEYARMTLVKAALRNQQIY